MDKLLKINLQDVVNIEGPDFSKFGCIHVIIPAGNGFGVQASGGTVSGTAINGTTFKGGGTTVTIANNAWGNFIAPDDANVEVLITKYYIGRIVSISNVSFHIIVKDIFAFDYMGIENSARNPFLQHDGILDMDNKPFGYMPGVTQFGTTDGNSKLFNFDWESPYNGLSSENFPNMTAFSVVKNAMLPITAYSRLTNVTFFALKQETNANYTYGKVEDLGNAFLANGRTTNFTIRSNGKITLNGNPVPWNKNVIGTYSDGDYVYSVSNP